MKKTEAFTVHVSDDLKRKFSALAHMRGISMSELASEIIARQIEIEEARYRVLHEVFGRQQNR